MTVRPVSARNDMMARKVKSTLDLREEFRAANVEVSWAPMPEPEVRKLSAAVRARMDRLHPIAGKAPRGVVAELEDMVDRHPQVATLKSWLCHAYRAIGDKEKARRLAETIVTDHPEFFSGRTALAELCLEDGDEEMAQRLLGPTGLPDGISPGRMKFHISEIRHFFVVSAKLHVSRLRFDAAKACRDLLAELEPGSPAVEELDALVSPAMRRRFKVLRALRDLSRAASTSWS